MRTRATALMVAFLLVLVPSLGVAAAAPAPTIRTQIRVDGLPPAGPAEVVNQVNDFQPGNQTALHTHPGLTVVTVLAGELTYRNPAEKVFAAGDNFFERPDVAHLALNAGTTPTRITTSYVMPKDAPVSTAQPGGPSPAPSPPATTHLARVPAIVPTGPYELVSAIVDFAAGAETPPQAHAGQVVSTVLTGEIIVVTGGATKAYKVGETFAEAPEAVAQLRNAGAAPASLLSTYVLQQGAPLATPTGTPAAGGGGMARHAAAPPGVLAVLALGGGLVIAGSLELRRRRRPA